MLRSLGENLTSQDFIKIALGKQHVFVILQNGDVRRPLVVPYPVLLQAIASSIDLPAGSAAWGSIATGGGVASQTDLVTYLNANYIDPTELSSALSNYVPTSRTLTINGTTYDLSANRSWTISGGGAVDSVNGQTGVVILELNDIDDVNAPSPTSGQVLQWNGTEWVAATISGSGTVTSVNSGININIDNTDPANPIVNSLSDRYKTTSTTSNSVSNGSKSFTIGTNLSYIPLQEILIVYDVANHMHGEVTSYNSSTGALVVDVKHHTGSGTYTAWTLNLDGTPVDALTGSGTTNEIAYFTAARVLASLPVATYPSLTELSYVKGVSSAIQTQINGKFNTPSGTTQQYVRGDGSVVDLPSGNYGLILRAVNGTAITGSTANTISLSGLVPANTNATNDTLRIKYRISKTGTSTVTTTRLYVNTVNSLSGATLLAQVATTAATRFLQSEREFFIKNNTTNTEAWPTSVAAFTDNAITTVATSSLAINHTVDQYYFVAIQNGGTGDSATVEFLRIERL